MNKSLIAALAVVSTFGIASIASAGCGPTVSLNANQNVNQVIGGTTNDSVGVAEYGDTFNFGSNTNSNETQGLTLGISLNFSLDGGRGCKLQDLQIANQKDQQLRARHQAEMQRQQAAAQLVNNLVQAITYCETADLDIPANAEFCSPYVKD